MASALYNLGYIILKIFHLVIKILPQNDYDALNTFTDYVSYLSNVFAWVNQFIPSKLISTLFVVSTFLFEAKLFMRIFERFTNSIK